MWLDPGTTDPMPVRKGTVIWIPAAACGAALAVLLTATVAGIDYTASALAAAALVLVILRGYSELRPRWLMRARTEEGLRASDARYRQLAEEQASLRRVATLVAQGVAAVEVFTAVASGDQADPRVRRRHAAAPGIRRHGNGVQLGRHAAAPYRRRRPENLLLLGAWWTVSLRTGRPARIDGFEGDPGSPGDELN